MTSSKSSEPTDWVALADVTEERRVAAMQRKYDELAIGSEEERVSRLMEMARAEYELPEDKLLAFTRTRLLVWVGMEPEKAKTVAYSYDQAMRKLPGVMDMRRVAAVQTVARTLTPGQRERLHEMIPSIVAALPHSGLAIEAPTTGGHAKTPLKDARIAFLLGLLPLLSVGSCALAVGGDPDESQGSPFALLLSAVLGFWGWGWAYVYLGHPFRAVAAFLAGAAGTFALFFVSLSMGGLIDAPYEVFEARKEFIMHSYAAILRGGALAGVAVGVDVAILALRHNRMVQEKEP